ncbi:hypothetical protein [Allobaculum sp. Allo2]|nr:hypothetical protein [Allobaculum sp. Allo2]
MIYRLDAIEAYNQRLVKKIAVKESLKQEQQQQTVLFTWKA